MKFSLSTPHINDILHGIVARNVNVKMTLLSNFYAKVSFLQIYGHILGRNDENSIGLLIETVSHISHVSRGNCSAKFKLHYNDSYKLPD